MSQPFIGEIRMFAGNFAPASWAFCNGQLMPISEYDALFFLLGTTYGGDGISTFAVPDMRGRIPVHAGIGPGLAIQHHLGDQAGSETVTLLPAQLPAHSHALNASTQNADSKNPRRRIPAITAEPAYAEGASAVTPMHASAIANSGGNEAHPNVMPVLCVHFIIALAGIYPSRT
jgi:microcystin-dependent protein